MFGSRDCVTFSDVSRVHRQQIDLLFERWNCATHRRVAKVFSIYRYDITVESFFSSVKDVNHDEKTEAMVVMDFSNQS